MAGDLATTPISGLRVQLCGDAHLANFGAFAAPDRKLVFDLNDFDETLPGPWEWDIKRLAASFTVAARDRGLDSRARRGATIAAVREYRLAMRRFAAMRTIDVWYARLEVAEQFERWSKQASASARKRLEATLAKAHSKDSLRALAKLTHDVDGEPRIISDPPLVVPLDELVQGAERPRIEEELIRVFERYRETLPFDRRHLLGGYRPVDMAHKVVGVGSVGTRAWIVLLLGNDSGDPLFLQIKEAEHSVLEPFAGPSHFSTSGQRVVEGQRLMQAAGDIFLGWTRVDSELDGRRTTTTCASCGTRRARRRSTQCRRGSWLPTPRSAAGPSPAPMPARATVSRSRATWGQGQLRRRARRVCRGLRGAERARLPRPHRSREGGPSRGPIRQLIEHELATHR